MNRRIRSLSLAFTMLMATSHLLQAGFFQIDGVNLHMTPPRDQSGVWWKEMDALGHSKDIFMPNLEVRLKPQQDIAGADIYVRVYFFDKNGKLISSLSSPAGPKISKNPADRNSYAMPVILKKDLMNKVYFEIPNGLHDGDYQAVIVFGDKDEAVAATYPMSAAANRLQYPEKKLVDDHFIKNIKRKVAVDPVVEYVAKSDRTHSNHPKITLFLRMPKGVSDPSELQGVMAICMLANNVTEIRSKLQLPELPGDYDGIFRYANDHKLALLVWGRTSTTWDPSKNYDAMADKAFRKMEDSLSDSADTWEKGVLDLSEQYGIPKRNFLLWGVCGAAQWVQRLCLRKPDYFLATYMMIPGSFDKPTPEASKVIWCLCTGELYGGYQNALKWYKECRTAGYPMIFKAYEGLGHSIGNESSRKMAFKFFDFALTQKNAREEHDKNINSRLAQAKLAASGQAQGPWPESFRNPPYYGDIVNQETYPADQVEMIPEGFRAPLPTKELADYWLTGK